MKNKLTVQEIDILIEALNAWKTHSKATSMLTGLLFGAMVSRGGNQSDGEQVYQAMMTGEDETEAERRQVADRLIEKLQSMRERAAAKEAKAVIREAAKAARTVA